jgi:2-polyprenyl-3-methyl-5-hydroxy-6-metoxy-1,4-benzoquinol methylase
MKLITKHVGGGRLLDVGCASGFFIETALKHGFDAYGVEFSKQAIAQAKPGIAERIVNGDVNSLHARHEQKFDIVVAFDIIEHTHDPIRFLRDIRGILSPRGWLVITTPDTGHFLRYLMGSRWPMLQPFQHTYLFSQKAMRKALETAGFNKIHIQDADKTLTLEYLMGQIKMNNPLLASVYRVISLLLPMTIRKKPFSVNIGEMMVFCQNGLL